jgi:hypothetical protein
MWRLLLQGGDIEANPGPINLASCGERERFTRASNQALQRWVIGNLGVVAYDVLAGVFAWCGDDPPRSDNFVAAATKHWRKVFECGVVEFPTGNPAEAAMVERAMVRWLEAKGPGTKEWIQRECSPVSSSSGYIQLGREEEGPAQKRRAGRPRKATPPEAPQQEQEQEAEQPHEMETHEMESQDLGVLGVVCPVEGCTRLVSGTWSLALHCNRLHQGVHLEPAALAEVELSSCQRCRAFAPLGRHCPQCNDFQGLVAMEVQGVLQGRLRPEPVPLPVPDREEEVHIRMVREILDHCQPTVVHVPVPARPMLGEILAKELAEFARERTVERMAKLLVLPQVLLVKGRGGQRRARADEARRQEAMDLWMAEDGPASLWQCQRVPKNQKGRKLRRPQRVQQEEQEEGAQLPQKVVTSVLSLTRQGLPGKAAKLLLSWGVAEWNRVTQAEVQRLFPPGNPEAVPRRVSEGAVFTEEEVGAALKAMGRGKSPGPSGLRTEHLRDLTEDTRCGDKVLEGLTAFVNAVAFGQCPREVASMLCSGQVVPLNKKDMSIRPMVVGECLRNLVATCWVGRVGSEMEDELAPRHLGIGKASGVGNSVQCAKLWARDLPEDHVLIKVDFRNAYNTVDRSKVVAAVAGRCEELAGWASWCLERGVAGGRDGAGEVHSRGAPGRPPLPTVLHARRSRGGNGA